ncbi:hypothetical protein CVT26_007543 [Gymnopilus dilepis]|uniref:Uncharacterized protein n=1 Tax=Gymnopilus dilepis TaxID=231916 RepID=A0A409WZ66_9AGAR|nr:hypothetical protein CVT26_007543 [Gymnopilus dilepis]
MGAMEQRNMIAREEFEKKKKAREARNLQYPRLRLTPRRCGRTVGGKKVDLLARLSDPSVTKNVTLRRHQKRG